MPRKARSVPIAYAPASRYSSILKGSVSVVYLVQQTQTAPQWQLLHVIGVELLTLLVCDKFEPFSGPNLITSIVFLARSRGADLIDAAAARSDIVRKKENNQTGSTW
ncbi:MAG: hypothetical protein C0469_16870 [Cyanobacteria bacterium DS2.3.42]|nr:hypothetical protein [Cyanobacteria bacterium DS2.3.42]